MVRLGTCYIYGRPQDLYIFCTEYCQFPVEQLFNTFKVSKRSRFNHFGHLSIFSGQIIVLSSTCYIYGRPQNLYSVGLGIVSVPCLTTI